jgi:hypothetical protein
MPQAITDYVPLADKFLQHWSSAEMALGRAITLEDATTRDGLQGLKDALIAAQDEAQTTENARQAGIKQRDNARAEAFPIARQARKSILGVIPSSEEARQLPTKFLPLTADAQKQLVALRDVEKVWASVNALPAGKYASLALPYTVLVDLGGTETTIALARYSAAVASLTVAASTVETAEQALTQAQQERKKAIEKLQAAFKAYRKAIRGLFPQTSALYRSLP